MLKRTTTIYVPIGEKPTNLPKKLNKRLVNKVMQPEYVLAHYVFSQQFVNYSETSDSGPSEKGTLYCKPLYSGQFLGPENSLSL